MEALQQRILLVVAALQARVLTCLEAWGIGFMIQGIGVSASFLCVDI